MAEQRDKICILFILLGVFVSYALARTITDELSISLEEKRIENLNFSGLSLVFYLNISNSSSRPFYLSGYDYRLVVNGIEYISLKTALEEKITINARETNLISLPLKITYDFLFQAVEGIEEEDKATGFLAGSLTFLSHRKKEDRIPFAFSAEFPVLKEPAVEFLTLQVNDLTIGGADLNFEIKFKNRNGFELLVDRIRYEVSLEDKPIGKGIIWDNKNIEKKGEKDFSIPLLINFFEVGKAVYNILQQPSVLCHFSGEAEVSTTWGKIKVFVEKREIINISRASLNWLSFFDD